MYINQIKHPVGLERTAHILSHAIVVFLSARRRARGETIKIKHVGETYKSIPFHTDLNGSLNFVSEAEANHYPQGNFEFCNLYDAGEFCEFCQEFNQQLAEDVREGEYHGR